MGVKTRRFKKDLFVRPTLSDYAKPIWGSEFAKNLRFWFRGRQFSWVVFANFGATGGLCDRGRCSRRCKLGVLDSLRAGVG